MLERVVGLVEDPERDVRDAALRLLREFMKYGDFNYSAVPFFPSLCTRGSTGLDFNLCLPDTRWNASAF
jgi:hypothetical protein